MQVAVNFQPMYYIYGHVLGELLVILECDEKEGLALDRSIRKGSQQALFKASDIT